MPGLARAHARGRSLLTRGAHQSYPGAEGENAAEGIPAHRLCQLRAKPSGNEPPWEAGRDAAHHQKPGRGGARRACGERRRRGGPFIGRSPRSRAPTPPARPRRHEICASAPSPAGGFPYLVKSRLSASSPPTPAPRLPPSLRGAKWRPARRARAPQPRPIPPPRRPNGPERGRPPPASPLRAHP